MDKVEQVARSSVGNWMYNIIWNARKGTNKWGWAFVFFANFFQLVWFPCALALVLHFTTSTKTGLGGIVAVFMVLSPIIYSAIDRSKAFSLTSNFIAVAGDMNRLFNNPSSGPLTKYIAKFGYLVSGVIALYLAFAIWKINRDRLSELELTQLDVLGNALAHGKYFWLEAKMVWFQMEMHYSRRDSINTNNRMQTSVSFALACKWALLEPKIREERKEWLLSVISNTLQEFPDLPEEVTMRLREALPIVIET